MDENKETQKPEKPTRDLPVFLQQTGERLKEFYEKRKLSREQIAVMYQNEVARFEATSPEKRQAFLEKGAVDPNEIPKDFNRRLTKMFPELMDFPTDEFIKMLNKALKKYRGPNGEKYTFKFKGMYLATGDKAQDFIHHLTWYRIRDLWVVLTQFIKHEKVVKHLVKYVAKRVKGKLRLVKP